MPTIAMDQEREVLAVSRRGIGRYKEPRRNSWNRNPDAPAADSRCSGAKPFRSPVGACFSQSLRLLAFYWSVQRDRPLQKLLPTARSAPAITAAIHYVGGV